MQHAGIDRIEVRAVDFDRLEVTAWDRSVRAARRGIFVEGEDFEISGGRIQLGGEVNAPSEAESATHFLGLSYEDVDLGPDEAGHGKYRKSETGGGLFLKRFSRKG